jgi:hypothetical protein
MENNPKRSIYYTFSSESIAIAFRIVFHSNLIFFFREKMSNNAILLIYFRGYC